jgi:hypothetical protein
MPPVGVEPADITIACGNPVPAPITPSFSDNCDPSLDVVMTADTIALVCGMQITRTWTATDDCGNAASVDRVIIREIASAPSIALTDPLLSGLSDGDTLTAECNNVPSFNVGDALAGDPCSSVTMSYQVGTPVVGDCLADGHLSVTPLSWIAANDCNSQDTLTIYLRVADTTPPSIGVPPSDITIACGDPVPAPVTPSFTDDCDMNLDIVMTVDTTLNGCDEVMTRRWVATDDCGNRDTVEQVVRRGNAGSPTVTLTDAMLVGLSDGDTLTVQCTSVPSFDAMDADANDPCSNVTVTHATGTPTIGACSTDGYMSITPNTWIATNDCGTMDSITVYVRVEDNVPPVFTSTPADTTIACGDPIPTCVQPTATDNCGSVTFSSMTNDVNVTGGFIRNCIWIAADDCGNRDTFTQEIFVEAVPTLDSVVTTPATCVGNDGTGTVYLAQDESYYTWTWSPDNGTPTNAVGNSRTDLPPGD